MAGKLFLIVGPSGVGKTVLLKKLADKHPEFYFPPSATTRKPRENEISGQQYCFLAPAEFQRQKAAGEFLETATIHGQAQYGTLKQPILTALAKQQVVIREVDVQGLQAIRPQIPQAQLRLVFIVPPNLATLQKRILKRQQQITPAELQARLASAQRELAFENEADYQIISRDDQLEAMVQELEGYILREADLVAGY